MSHITVGKPNITNIDAAKLAATKLGMEVTEKQKYRTYYGQSEAPSDKEIVCVFSVPERSFARHKITTYEARQKPYELALLRDKNNPEQMSLAYDSHCGGYGLERVIGETLWTMEKDKEEESILAPNFLMFYQMSLTEITAAELGDEVEFKELEDGSWQSVTRPKTERLEVTF